MQQFEGRVAVVTGAGGKVGLALSRRFAREGMSVVLADVNAEDLASSQAQLTGEGIAADRLLTVETDVTSSDSVQRLADAAVEAFGGVHVVCNNAGVNPQDLSIWEATEEDWRWALGVNLWGAIHGTRIFIPLMLAQGEEGHLVNTASAAGLGARPGMGSYVVSKTGIVALTEVLYHELQRLDAKVGCSVLCPGRIRGGGTRNRRPDQFRSPGDEAQAARDRELYERAIARQAETGGPGYIPPDDVAGLVFDGVREGRFYIFTHPEATAQRVRERTEALAALDPPALAGSIF